jgi:hypothetical protein
LAGKMLVIARASAAESDLNWCFPEEYAGYVGIHGERGPLGPHSHMILYGERPATRRRYCAVPKTGAGE